MHLSPLLITLITGLIVLFSLVCGLATTVLVLRKDRRGSTAALAGFAAVGTVLMLGFNLMLMVAALA